MQTFALDMACSVKLCMLSLEREIVHVRNTARKRTRKRRRKWHSMHEIADEIWYWPKHVRKLFRLRPIFKGDVVYRHFTYLIKTHQPAQCNYEYHIAAPT